MLCHHNNTNDDGENARDYRIQWMVELQTNVTTQIQMLGEPGSNQKWQIFRQLQPQVSTGIG